jgi:glycosyltransferase involved in cell wall biosynthesis
MSPSAIHQFVPNIEPGAVGTHSRVARDALRTAGYESEIFTAEVHPECSGWGVRGIGDYGRSCRERPDDVLVYQMAIGSTVADAVLGRSQPLVVNHHNLTPVRYFAGWEPVAAHAVVWGRHQLRALAGRATLGIAVSRYNEGDLVDAGFANTTVVPFLLDRATLDRSADPQIVEQLRSGRRGAHWLFVGRLAPNKAQHDVIKAFAAYRRLYDPEATLTLVGGGVDGRYGRALRGFVDALDLGAAVELAGGVDAATLAAYYSAADLYVSCSEHEGFCVPLIEAMHAELPIVAFAAAAVPETAGPAAVLLDAKDPLTVATAARRVAGDAGLRAALVAAGRHRLARYDPAVTEAAFVAAVSSVGTP